MTIDRHLKHLAQKDPENRQKALLDVLIQEGLSLAFRNRNRPFRTLAEYVTTF